MARCAFRPDRLPRYRAWFAPRLDAIQATLATHLVRGDPVTEHWLMLALEQARAQLGELERAWRWDVRAHAMEAAVNPVQAESRLDSLLTSLERRAGITQVPTPTVTAPSPPRPRLVTSAVACQRFEVRPRTLRRAVKIGELTDHREPGHRPNATLRLDESELERRFRRRPDPG